MTRNRRQTMNPTETPTPPERFNFARHLIALNAGRASKTALIDDAGALTYGQLAEQVQRFSAALQALGLKREERVLLLMHDSSDWVVAFLGALHAGVVPVCVNTLLTAKDYAYMLADSRAQAALVSAALLPTLQTALDAGGNEVKQLVVSRAKDPQPAGAHDFAALVAAHAPGSGLSFPLSVGASVVLMAERPTPQAVFKRMTEHRPTVFYGAPTGYSGMLASPELPTREQVAVRLCSSAGEALPRDIGERWSARFGCEIIDGIGSTEMLHIFLSNRPGDVRYGTTGKPVPGYEVQLRDEDGSVITGHNMIGDLYIQGPSSALLYWNNRAKSRDTFQGAWTKSGDKYTRDPDGYYTYAGRNDDMLKVSGIYVSPFEVEATLVQHPAVLEAAVIGKTDDDGLVKTKAYVVLKAGAQATEAELQTFVKEKLAPYKYPRFIEFMTELPKTATGKIQRFKLRELENQRLFVHR